MATVPVINDGNTYAVKTTDTPPIVPGEEPLRWGLLDANNLRARLVEHADAINTNAAALFPVVQAAHTTATRLLAASDAGGIIPMDGTSNAIEVTIPNTLWEAGGTGRATVLQLKVVSVAGGALTFVGSGGIVVSYSGKDPGVDPYIAGDYITVIVDSATTARVFAVEVL